MKVKITKQTTWTIEITPVQTKKSSTGGQANQQSNSTTIRIVNHSK